MMLTLEKEEIEIHMDFNDLLNILIVIKNCPICRNEVNDENVMENPAAKVVNAAMNTAEPTRLTDSVTRVTRSI